MVMDLFNYADFVKYYSGKKVFLTGHTGFKGSWMLNWLHYIGAEVKGYALDPITEDDLYNVSEGDKKCNSIIADIRNKEKLQKEILDFQPDFIFHLAAQPLVRYSYESPLETYEVNVLGTAYLLDTVRFLKKQCCVVLITTDKVYENKEWDYPYREVDRLGGYDPYSSSKACAELLINSYRNSFFSPVNFAEHKKSIASARAGNVIGGGDYSKDRLIPDIVKAFINNEPVLIRNPNSVRPWQHVLEPIAGYLLLGVRMCECPEEFNSSWNFGPNMEDNVTVKNLSEISLKIWGSGEILMPTLIDQPHEATFLRLDISKTVNQIGWKPKMNSTEAIEMTLAFYKAYHQNKTCLVEDQIIKYINSN
jgi:CDP-glucose 4,6-dehydratase